MPRALTFFLLTAATAFAASGGSGRLAKWHLEAVFSRIEEEVAGGPRLTTYAFAVAETDASESLSIRRITVSSFGRDVIKWDEETRKFRDLLEGARVSITVIVPLSAVRRAEASGSGELAVDPDQIEIDAPPALADRPPAPPAAGADPAPPFVLGADISALDGPETWRGPLPAYQENGHPADELTILRRHGWNAFRVRVFVAPVRKAPANTLAAAVPLAQRIKAAGAVFLLDLHFSDTWADPQHQEIPVAWRGLGIDGLERMWEQHAFAAIKAFRDAGAMPDWVQIGNEITRGAAWPLAQLQPPGSTEYPPPPPYDEARQWSNLIRLLQAGIRGVKAAAGEHPPRIAIHIDQGGNWPVTEWFFDHLEAAHVDYDIIAQSFYPEWNHGTLEQLRENMNRCAERYHKDFLVVETGYGTSHVKNNPSMLWPGTPAGRLQFMADLINTVRKAPRGLGVMYWAPEHEAWQADGEPGPVVFVLDRLDELSARPESHAPAAVSGKR